MKLNILAAGVAAVLSMVALSAHATNGYFSHGYGMKSKGMAGAATATANDTFGGANNPATMVWVGNRIDLGADLFSPDQGFSRFGGLATQGNGSGESEDDYFLIPEFGYNRMLNPNMSLGVSVYGNGGMNTDYPGGTFNCTALGGGATVNGLCGTGDLGQDLSQLIIAPTFAYRLNENHSVGISPLLGYQRFSAYGLNFFSGFSNSNGALTNRGYDDSYGWGVRAGWFGKLSDKVSVGAAYASKMSMSKFDKYAGLFAEQGDFDIPSNYNVGIAIQATPQLKLALDYQRINYTDVKSVSNPQNNLLACMGGDTNSCLGGNNGAGFGWQDVDTFKLGVEYQYSKQLTLRAGWNHGDNPIRGQDVTFNIIAPGVVKDHLTLGFSYIMPSGGELSMAIMHAFEESVTASSFFQNFGAAGSTETIKMNQNSIGIAYSWKM